MRFRAVMMTSIAFILGLLPLVVATGAAEISRRAVGTAVFGGMLAASSIGIFMVPMLYVGVPRTAVIVVAPIMAEVERDEGHPDLRGDLDQTTAVALVVGLQEASGHPAAIRPDADVAPVPALLAAENLDRRTGPQPQNRRVVRPRAGPQAERGCRVSRAPHSPPAPPGRRRPARQRRPGQASISLFELQGHRSSPFIQLNAEAGRSGRREARGAAPCLTSLRLQPLAATRRSSVSSPFSSTQALNGDSAGPVWRMMSR
jgi:hypothetical protein